MKDKDLENIIEGGALCLTVPLAVGGWLYRAYILTVLAGWFICEPFELPAIEWLHAAGLLLVVSLFHRRLTHPDKKKEDFPALGNMMQVGVHCYVHPSLLAGMGWVVRNCF